MIKTDLKCPECNTRMWFVRADKYYCKHCKKEFWLKFDLAVKFIKPKIEED